MHRKVWNARAGLRLIRAGDLVGAPTPVVAESAEIGHALSVARRHGLSILPVVAGTEFVGIFRARIPPGANPHATVGDFLDRTVPTLPASADLRTVMRTLEESPDPEPVVVVTTPANLPLGLTTRDDFLRVMMSETGIGVPNAWVTVEFDPAELDLKTALVVSAVGGALVTGWDGLDSGRPGRSRFGLRADASSLEELAGTLSRAGFSVLDIGWLSPSDATRAVTRN